MGKYVLVVDFRANSITRFYHFRMEASTIIEAMNEAEIYFSEDVYQVKIAERTGRKLKVHKGTKTFFKEILVNRGSGWHACDDYHGESSSTWEFFDTASGSSSQFQIAP